MIKAIITDVDGVIVGKQKGIDFPLPNEAVMRTLKNLQKKGIPVVLNTAKFNIAVREIITSAELRNPHITDGGALIIDPLEGKIIKKHVFKKVLAKEIVKASIEHGFYTEFYTVDDWFVQKDQVGGFTEKRTVILQQEHREVDSLIDHAGSIEVIKIFAFIHKQEDKEHVDKMLQPFLDQIQVVWTYHPTTYPSQNAVITVKGVSKKDATLEVLDYLNISPDEALGIGDSLGDWNFMNECGYVAVVGNASEQLLAHAKSKGEGNYFLAKDVEMNGFLDILEYFL